MAPSQICRYFEWHGIAEDIVMPRETVRWTISNHEAQVVCVERTADTNFELHVRYRNLPVASRRCVDSADAERWSDELRCAWEAAGWK